MERPGTSGEGAKLSKQDRRNLNKQKRKALETPGAPAPPVSTAVAAAHASTNAVKRQSPTHIEPVHKKSKPSSEEAVATTTTVNRIIKPASLWNFAVDYNDHFETPPIAYTDICPLLQAFAAYMSKTPADLTIYDPYWCEGSVVSHLRNLGFPNVINRNRDFYADIKKKCVPGYDMLVTNPPYSGEHKVNLLKFLAAHTNAATSGTKAKTLTESTATASNTTASASHSSDTSNSTLPFALLLPVYVATKSYWKDFAQQQNSVGKDTFYILPPDYYEYSHPEGTGKDIPPFYSAWFVGGFTSSARARVIEALRSNPRRSSNSTSTATAVLKKLSFSSLVVVESIEGLVQRGVVVDSKRPNPKQRHKMKAKHVK